MCVLAPQMNACMHACLGTYSMQAWVMSEAWVMSQANKTEQDLFWIFKRMQEAFKICNPARCTPSTPGINRCCRFSFDMGMGNIGKASLCEAYPGQWYRLVFISRCTCETSWGPCFWFEAVSILMSPCGLHWPLFVSLSYLTFKLDWC